MDSTTSSNDIVMDDPFDLLPPTPLIYPDISGTNQYTNILLIESAVPDYQKVVDSVNASTLPIVYSVLSQKIDLLALLRANFTTIPRIGLFFTSSSGRTKMFLDREPLFIDDETVPYSENVQFISNIITEFQVQNIDYLACDTLNYPNWENYYAILTNVGVTVGASNDKTGNIKYGGDWVLESTSQDVEFVYFTQSIEYYTYLLDNPSWATIINCFGCVYDNFGNLYVSTSSNNTIVKVPINNPGGATTWFSSGLNSPRPMCIYQNYLYVANYGNNTILKIDLNYPTSYTTFITFPSNMTIPNSLDTDGTYLYLLMTGFSNIYKISLTYPASDYDFSWGTSLGLGGSTPSNIRTMVIKDNYMYVTHTIGNTNTVKIAKINVTQPITDINLSWATIQNYYSLYYSGSIIYDRYIYIGNSEFKRIFRISLDYPNAVYNMNWAILSVSTSTVLSFATDNKYIYLTSFLDNKIAQISLPPIPPITNFYGTGGITGTGSMIRITNFS